MTLRHRELALDMPPHISAPGSARIVEWIALALIAIVALCIYGWTAAGGIGIIGFSDSADYLFYADFYRSQFAGQLRPEAVEFYRATRFPPLFPLLLAAFGGGNDAPHQTQFVALVITLWMLVMLWAWLRRETASPTSAATIVFLVVLSPGLFLLTLNPVSEPLAMGLMWLAFLLAAHPETRSDRFLLIALIAGLSTLARSANIVLVAAIPVWLYLRGATRKQLVTATTVAFAPFLAWFAYRRSIPNTTSYLDGVGLDEDVIAQMGGWPDLLYLHPWRFVTGLAKNFDYTPDALSIGIALLILASAAYGWWRRMGERKLDAFFLGFYVALILIWPYPREAPRFMTFVLPLLFLYALLGFGSSMQRVSERFRRSAPALLALLVLLASGSTIQHFVDLATLSVDEELAGEQREQNYFHAADRAAALRVAEGNARIRLAAREAALRLPPGECAYAVMPYLLERHAPVAVVLYPRRFTPEKPIAEQLWRCNYFFVAGIAGAWPEHRAFFPLEQLRSWTNPVVMAEVGNGFMLAALLTRNSAISDEDETQPREADQP